MSLHLYLYDNDYYHFIVSVIDVSSEHPCKIIQLNVNYVVSRLFNHQQDFPQYLSQFWLSRSSHTWWANHFSETYKKLYNHYSHFLARITLWEKHYAKTCYSTYTIKFGKEFCKQLFTHNHSKINLWRNKTYGKCEKNSCLLF